MVLAARERRCMLAGEGGGMGEGAEAGGGVMTGALAAHAVEPVTGEQPPGGHVCLNCGTALTGSYCHHCGQSAHVHRSLSHFGREILHSVLHFEGKIWRTLPLLALRPGQLTR